MVKKQSGRDHINLSIAWSGWGKVSSARAITRLISYASRKDKVDLIIFTGVAGAISEKLDQWDLVVAESLVFHDINKNPFFGPYVIPALEKSEIKSDKNLIEWAYSTLSKTIKENKIPFCRNIYKGLICTGDQFINDKEQLSSFLNYFPDAIAVEMEGAAIAQIAFQEKIPSIVLRVISDSADSESSYDFPTFINSYKNYSWYIIEALLKNLDNAPL